LLVTGLAPLALGACALNRPSSLDILNAKPSVAYRGHYTIGSTGSWFRPCDAAAVDSAMWVTATGAAVAQLDSAKRAGALPDGESSYVDWRGVITRGGEVGPRGPGAPALLVRDVRVVRKAAAGDCAGPS
jgi:hypothetical protein